MGVSRDEHNQSSVGAQVAFAGLCRVCLSPAEYVCPTCQAVSYCCTAHMAAHWNDHNRFCAALNRITKDNQGFRYGVNIPNAETWRRLRVGLVSRMSKLLGNALTPEDTQLLLFPRHCRACYNTTPNQLKSCENCHQVWHCANAPQHKNPNHKDWCEQLQLYRQLACNHTKLNGISIDVDNCDSKTKKLNLKANIKETIMDALQMKYLDILNAAAISQTASAPLTVLRVLLTAISAKTITYQSTLVVHLVGAEMRYEGGCPAAWEYFLLHYLPPDKVRKLIVVMVGPELDVAEDKHVVRLCDRCEMSERSIELHFKPGLLYHEYAKSKNYMKPNLICALNAGLHRVTGYAGSDTWPETIRAALSSPGRIFAVTAYTKHEAPLDLKRVKDCCGNKISILQNAQPNPYASLKPDRNFISDHEAPLIYKNYYMSIITVKKK